MRWIWLVVGVLVVAVGIVWTLQGLNILGGSAMSGHAIFAVLGPMVLALGLAVVGVGVWRRRVPAD
jgi:hypothetical protein